MSAQIIADDEDQHGVYACWYHGGAAYGVSHQITQANGAFITLREDHMTMLVERVTPFLPKRVRP